MDTTTEKKDGTKSEVKKNKGKLGKFLKYTLYTIIITSLIVGSTGLFIMYTVMKDIGEIDLGILKNAMSQASTVYDSSGKKIGEFESPESRIVVGIEDIPDQLIKALLAIEDTNFYEHNGFNIKRTISAALHNLSVGYASQGGSTLTQQLAKGVFLTNEKTIERKIKELCYAIMLEQQLTKDEILEAYMNTMYLGKSSYGVASAAKNYFNKDLDELTLAESALLAGITKYPTKYDAYKALKISVDDDFENLELVFYDLPKDVSEEDQEVYKKLLEKKLITQIQYDSLSSGKRTVFKAVFNEESKKRQEVVLGRMLEVGYITSEEYNEAIAEKIKIDVPEEKDTEVTSYFVDYVKGEVIDELVKQNYTRDEAVNMLYSGGLKIYTTLDTNIQKKTEKEFANNNNFPYTKNNSAGIPQPQGAMVILDYRTGGIKAMVGGRGLNGSNLYNRATNPRQPGSTIKPLAVYLPALMSTNIYPNSIVKDEPMYYNGGNTPYPNNYQKKYRGNITLTEAVKWSSNVVAARTLLSLADTPKEAFKVSLDFMRELGITTLVSREESPSHHDENLPIALGGISKGISPLEMAAAYGVIANDGVYVKPTAVTKVVDNEGVVVYESKTEKKKVFSSQVAQRMTQMLRAVVTGGTATRAQLSSGIESAGKTGTTSDSKDIWFIGYTPYYVAATWMGEDTPKELPVGSTTAVRLWDAVMESVHEGLPVKKFYSNKDVVEVTICEETGLLANKKDKLINKDVKVEFIKGTEPTKYCDKHEYTDYDAWLEKKKKEEEEQKKQESSNESSSNGSSNNSSSNSGSSSNGTGTIVTPSGGSAAGGSQPQAENNSTGTTESTSSQ